CTYLLVGASVVVVREERGLHALRFGELALGLGQQVADRRRARVEAVDLSPLPSNFLAQQLRVDVGVALFLWCWRRRRDHSDGRDRRDVRDDDRVDRCGAADGARDDGLLVPLDCLRGRLLRVVRLCGRLPLVRGGRLGLLVRAPPSLAVRAALLPQLRDALRVFLGRRVHRT
ncbi:unnamed protein product, partial [Pelagomonas calceolata]